MQQRSNGPDWLDNSNLEYFHGHVRIEGMLFDGARVPVEGRLYPDLSRPGLGLELKRVDVDIAQGSDSG